MALDADLFFDCVLPIAVFLYKPEVLQFLQVPVSHAGAAESQVSHDVPWALRFPFSHQVDVHLEGGALKLFVSVQPVNSSTGRTRRSRC